jgi:hypothetical protein
MSQNTHGRAPDPAAGASCSGNNSSVKGDATSTSTQALRAIRVAIVRAQLKLGPIPLSLLSDDRGEWAARGLTIAHRDTAAAALVKAGEARYEALPEQRWAQGHPVVHLVATGEKAGQ